MQLDALRIFLEVADTHSFTDAARLHPCTPANASHSFHAMETEFDMPLAEPGLRRIHLNDAGQVCHDYCRNIVSLEDELIDSMNKMREGSGAIEIAACLCIGLYRLPPLLLQFQQAFPDIAVHVHLESHNGVHQAVLNNDVDAGLVPYPRHERGLTVAVFRRVPLVLACHPATRLSPLSAIEYRRGFPGAGQLPCLEKSGGMQHDKEWNHIRRYEDEG